MKKIYIYHSKFFICFKLLAFCLPPYGSYLYINHLQATTIDMLLDFYLPKVLSIWQNLPDGLQYIIIIMLLIWFVPQLIATAHFIVKSSLNNFCKNNFQAASII